MTQNQTQTQNLYHHLGSGPVTVMLFDNPAGGTIWVTMVGPPNFDEASEAAADLLSERVSSKVFWEQQLLLIV